MATSSGVRTWIGMTPVPRERVGAAAPSADSSEKASVPLASATHTDR